ncbi:PREDICTED: probable ADP-ribosylation factor GTPase-activating protein AGD8 [Camelina sativa]|uniref:Probable ADP-ribosylation factor GTPase-activating protein AGD8 n=1 Tax=Camelina sativa TaxID=90675 RepID=A0ABM1QEU4_CAMSA|nr:PREDICTED: probable ADP-ribosylation factor GTPase-activating protein AGD8 [Camelina sativa]
MMLGGNNRAQGFFKQYGWTNGGNIEAKYSSQAALLYSQILAKEVVEAMAEESTTGLPPAKESTSAIYLPKAFYPVFPSTFTKPICTSAISLPEAFYPVFPSTFTKPICEKRTRTIGAPNPPTTKPKENLYEQEFAPPFLTESSSTNDSGMEASAGSSFASQFEYNDDLQSGMHGSCRRRVLSPVAPPNSLSFSADLRMDSSLPKESSPSSSKVLVEESDEARKTFSNANSISSSAQFSGEKLSNAFSSLTMELGTMSSAFTRGLKDVFQFRGYPDVNGLRRDVIDLTQKLHSLEALTIPWETRMKWVDKLCVRVERGTIGAFEGDLQRIIRRLRNDVRALSRLLEHERCKNRGEGLKLD